MATSGAHTTGSGAGAHSTTHDRTPAQWYCLLVGTVLTLVGLAGFLADSSFDTGDGVQGDSLLGFEVNGLHNIVHLLSGLLLLASAAKRASAKTVALAFGLTYLLVTIIGFADGEDVLTLIPVNDADNVLHLVLSLAGIGAALASRSGPDRSRH